MCEEDTKQKFLLLSAFPAVGEAVLKSDVRERLCDLSNTLFQTTRYVNQPEPFETLIEEGIDDRTIIPAKGDKLLLTEIGLSNRENSFRPYVEASLLP